MFLEGKHWCLTDCASTTCTLIQNEWGVLPCNGHGISLAGSVCIGASGGSGGGGIVLHHPCKYTGQISINTLLLHIVIQIENGGS